jgi:hypothetical protein
MNIPEYSLPVVSGEKALSTLVLMLMPGRFVAHTMFSSSSFQSGHVPKVIFSRRDERNDNVYLGILENAAHHALSGYRKATIESSPNP